MKDSIRHLIQQALDRLTADGVLPAGLTPSIQVENTRDKSHGDFARNIALMLAKPDGLIRCGDTQVSTLPHRSATMPWACVDHVARTERQSAQADRSRQ